MDMGIGGNSAAVVFLHHRKAQFLLMELPRSCMMVK
jgi:hypothetical protein